MSSIVGIISKGGMPFSVLMYEIILNKVMAYWTILVAILLIMLI